MAHSQEDMLDDDSPPDDDVQMADSDAEGAETRTPDAADFMVTLSNASDEAVALEARDRQEKLAFPRLQHLAFRPRTTSVGDAPIDTPEELTPSKFLAQLGSQPGDDHQKQHLSFRPRQPMAPVEAPNEPPSEVNQQPQVTSDAALANQLDVYYNFGPGLQEASPQPASGQVDQPLIFMDQQNGMPTRKPGSPGTNFGWAKAGRKRLDEWACQQYVEFQNNLADLESRDISRNVASLKSQQEDADAIAWRISESGQSRLNFEASPRLKLEAAQRLKLEAASTAADEALARDVEKRLAMERDTKAAMELADELGGVEGYGGVRWGETRSDADVWQDFAGSDDGEDDFDDADEPEREALSSDDVMDERPS